jgi:hypothetical protein
VGRLESLRRTGGACRYRYTFISQDRRRDSLLCLETEVGVVGQPLHGMSVQVGSGMGRALSHETVRAERSAVPPRR